jgi:hypothetical protein
MQELGSMGFDWRMSEASYSESDSVFMRVEWHEATIGYQTPWYLKVPVKVKA